jgi:phage shock protein A
MKLLERASRLLKANINHMLDAAEDPEVMIKDLIREMDESVAELRRETVNAVARQKQLEKKVEVAGKRAEELESQAVLAVENNDEKLARQILGRRVDTLKSRESLTDELRGATELARQLKSDLVRMQGQAGVARRKKDELIRRKHAAEARLRTQEAARRSADAMSAATGRVGEIAAAGSSFDGYADSIGQMEARAEAAHEMADETDDGEQQLRELVEASDVDRELERVKQKAASS